MLQGLSVSFGKTDRRLSVGISFEITRNYYPKKNVIRNASSVFICLSYILSCETVCPSLLLVAYIFVTRVVDQLVWFMFYLVYDHFSPDHDPTSGSVCLWNVCVFFFLVMQRWNRRKHSKWKHLYLSAPLLVHFSTQWERRIRIRHRVTSIPPATVCVRSGQISAMLSSDNLVCVIRHTPTHHRLNISCVNMH